MLDSAWGILVGGAVRLSSIPPSATDQAVVTVAVASLEANTRPPSSDDVDVLLELYRTRANADGLVRRQSVWLERVKSEGG